MKRKGFRFSIDVPSVAVCRAKREWRRRDIPRAIASRVAGVATTPPSSREDGHDAVQRATTRRTPLATAARLTSFGGYFATSASHLISTLNSRLFKAERIPLLLFLNAQLTTRNSFNCKFYQLPSIIYQLPSTSYAKKFITRLTIISFSDGLDSAIITVKATSVWSAMRLEPSLRSSNLFRLRK